MHPLWPAAPRPSAVAGVCIVLSFFLLKMQEQMKVKIVVEKKQMLEIVEIMTPKKFLVGIYWFVSW